MGCSCCKSLKTFIFPCGFKKRSNLDLNGFSYHYDEQLVGRLRVHKDELQVNLCPNPPTAQKTKNRRFSYMRALQEVEESSVESIDPPGLNMGELLENRIFGSRNTIAALEETELREGIFYRDPTDDLIRQNKLKSRSIPANLHSLYA